MDGWMDGWLDGWIYVCMDALFISLFYFKLFPLLPKSFCCLDLLALKITSPAETWLPFSHFAISVGFDNFAIIFHSVSASCLFVNQQKLVFV